MTVSNDDLASRLAVVETEIRHINKSMDSQNGILEDQSKDIKKLLSMADKSSGALWAVMGVSGGIGAIISFLIDKLWK